MHSFVEELWAEWQTFPLEDTENVSYEVSGLVMGLRALKDDFVQLHSSRFWALRRLLRIWKNSLWAKKWNIANGVKLPAQAKGCVQLILPHETYDEIRAYGDPRHQDWGRGFWGACGALYVPKSGYYLVLRICDPLNLPYAKKLFQKIKISWSERSVHNVREMILRDQQDIVSFLSKIGLTSISLRMEDKAILRSMRDQANRMRNCDTANIKKSLKVAEEQLALVQKLRDNGLISSLPSHLRELAETRLENPEASLSELGVMLDPPITKSTVKYRWKRLTDFVGEIS